MLGLLNKYTIFVHIEASHFFMSCYLKTVCSTPCRTAKNVSRHCPATATVHLIYTMQMFCPTQKRLFQLKSNMLVIFFDDSQQQIRSRNIFFSVDLGSQLCFIEKIMQKQKQKTFSEIKPTSLDSHFLSKFC